MVSREIDIFETVGGEPNSVKHEDDKRSEAVETIDVTFQSSFNEFKGKQLRLNNANFSDSIIKPVQYGFRAALNEYELEGSNTTKETLIQRYHRLKVEVTELLNEIEQLKDPSKDLPNVNTSDIIGDLQQLQSNLHQVEVDKVLADSSVLTGNGHASHTVLLQQLQSQLSAAKSTTGESKSKQDGSVYEIYGNIEAAKFGHLSKLSELEKRLTTLEGVVGKSENTKLSIVSSGLNAEHKDLSSAVLGLQSKIALLDSDHVMSITDRLTELMGALKSSQSKHQQEDGTREKVEEALKTVEAITPLISVVPDVVNRLHALKDLHMHASQLVSTITNISTEQDRISEQLANLKDLLDNVQGNVTTNLGTLQSNLNSIEDRMKSKSL